MSEVEGREETETDEPQEDAEQRPKVRMPQAKDIKANDLGRSEFTPHALGAKGRPTARTGTRAAAKRRRVVYSAIGVVVVAALAVGTVWWETRPAPSVKFRGAFGKAPSVSVPKAKPAVKRQIKELIRGTGPKVAGNDFVVAQLVGYTWSSSGKKEVLNTYKKGKPVGGTASSLTGLPALDKQLAGHTAGTRLQLTLPYQDVGDQIAQALQMGKADDLAVSVDLIKSYGKTSTVSGTQQPLDAKLPQVTPGAAGQEPTVKIPAGAAPTALTAKTLIQGTGKAVAKGDTLVAQYDGVLWRNGKSFDSSYKHGAPAAFSIGVGQVIPGWDKTLVGQKVGSRVLLIIPPKEGYGSKGSTDAGIKGTDTLVFVVDILDSL